MKTVAIFLAVLCFATGAPTFDDRIVGGTIAKPGDFPYVVSITENGRHICGGFIYNEKWIVTAASCVEKKTAGSLSVVLGQLLLTETDPGEITLSVFQIKIIPQYDSTTKFNDIALLQVNKVIDFSQPDQVFFLKYNEVDPNSAGAFTMGWGATYDGGLESTKLRSASLEIQSGTVCGKYSTLEYNFPTMICAQGDAVNADSGTPCQYDEGSPLVQTIDGRPIAVGIVSRFKCLVEEPSIHTRISVFYSWLLKEAGSQPTIVPPTDSPTEEPEVTDEPTEEVTDPATEAPEVTDEPTEEVTDPATDAP